MLHETHTTVARGHLSSSVVTWSKELDFRFKSELEVEVTIFTNTLVWIWGLILSETRVSQGHSEAPWWTREFLVCPSTLGWAGGLGFHSPFAPAMNWRENSLGVFQPDVAFRSQVRGRGTNARHQLLPAPSCPGGAPALLLYCPTTSSDIPGCLRLRHSAASTNHVQLSVQLPGAAPTAGFFPTSNQLWKDRCPGRRESQN